MAPEHGSSRELWDNTKLHHVDRTDTLTALS
jgi:hypothetical protein